VTKYAAGQLVFAVAITVIGAVKAYRIVVDQVDDALSNLVGLT